MINNLHPRVDEIATRLAEQGPTSLEKLASMADVLPVVLRRQLEAHPYLVPTPAGEWVNGLLLADGVAFTHELSAAEIESGMLAADDDLALWAQFAKAGLPLAGGGEVKATTMLDQPAFVGTGLPAGSGMIGQLLTGPDGWLTGFSAGDLLSVRLRDGSLEISRARLPKITRRAERVRDACVMASVQALNLYLEETADITVAPLHEILLQLLLTEPTNFASPLPPLARMLRAAGMETFGGCVGVPGAPWNLARIRGLDRAEVVAGTMALGLLLAWIDDDPQHAPSLLRDYLSTTPAVVGYVAAEVERRTAEGTRFGPQLAELRSIARTGLERAAVAMLAARAAEGAGDSEAAERLVHEALAAQPDLPAALADAGEYAACRGDMRAADDYLRHSGHHPSEALRGPIKRLLVDPKSATGRNQPCPCGSGRKYKACCAAKAVHPLADRAEAVYALLATYAQRARAGETLSELLGRSGGNEQSAMLCVDLLLTDCGLTERFLRDRGGWLREDERRLVESWRHIPIGSFEVRDVRPGVGVTVRALPDGEPVFLKDRLLSTSVRRLELFCGRILHDDTRPRMLTIPARVPREQRRELSELLAGRPSAHQVAEFFAPRPEPHLRNGDGHEYFDTDVVWEVPDERRAWSRLNDRLVRIDDDILELHAERGGKTTSLGRVTREGGRWRLWANSRERLAEFEEIVRVIAPGTREVTRRADRMGGEPHPRARALVMESFFVSAEGSEQDMWRAHRESWPDTPNDLGMTPREASQVGGAVQAELEMMLDDMDWNNDRNLEHGRPLLMDVAWIRRELGMERAR
ncbi:SEC-C domain-containing protein [Acrocarpospora sp. B8E8]|uniref:SEC-C domain-containing protein n=1 Tax=Acrocarpospora sp. B8E8 TaxID=3153572 RepID=UPI00325C4CFE